MIVRASFGAAVVCVALGMGLLPAAAGANAPITSYSAVPGNDQAGGHPDVEVNFSVENRLVQGSQSACNCEISKTPRPFSGWLNR